MPNKECIQGKERLPKQDYMPADRRELIWGVVGTALALLVFFCFAALGWPGQPSGCALKTPDTCFCERFLRAGELSKQPANTWGNLGFITVGLFILRQVGTDRARAVVPRNPMTSATSYATVYGVLVVFLGPASMFFHASITRWGNWIDTFSMILYASFGLLYALQRSFKWAGYVLPAIYLGLTSPLGIYSWLVPGTGTPLFTVLLIMWILTELVILWLKPGGLRRRWQPFALALATFVLALVVWSLSQTAAPLCDPNSLLQGHAIWHLLCAVATWFIFLYLRSETGRPSTVPATAAAL